MSKITVHNYEAFLLDYVEGNLDDTLIEELKQFALSHPELEIDLTETNLPYIAELSIEAEFKESLKKKEKPLEDEELLSYLEGLMDPEDKKHFEKKLSGIPDLKKAFDTYQKTLLQVDAEELFGDKSTLIKTEDDLILSDRTIAYIEGLLLNEEKLNFEKLLASDEGLRRDVQLTSKTLLIRENEIVYPNKEALKKETRVFVLYGHKMLLRVAAAILLLTFLTVTFNYLKTGDQPAKGMSHKNSSNKTKPIVPDNSSFLKRGNKSAIKKEINSSSEFARLNRTSDKSKNVSVIPENKGKIETHQVNSNSEKNKEDVPDLAKQEEQNSTLKKVAEAGQEQINNKVNVSVDSSTSDSNTSVTYKITELATIEEGSEEEFYSTPSQKQEKGLWRRAVQLAQRANKLGVKSVDGMEDSHNKQYRISFNSFSVEKK